MASSTRSLLHFGRRMVRKLRQRVFPIPWLARRFLRRSGAAFATGVRQGGVCLDVGAGVAPYRREIEQGFAIGHYIAFDIAASDATTLIGDASRLPLRDGCIDLVVSMDTVQHIPDAARTFDEMARVMAPGALVVLSFPFTYGECDMLDFRRWSLQGMAAEWTSRGFEVLDLQRRGGALFAAACAVQWAVQHAIPGGRSGWRTGSSPLSVLRAAIVQLLTIPTAALAWLALALDGLLPAAGLYMGGLIVARRPARETIAP